MKEPKPHHDLLALAERKGWRQLELVKRGEAYLSERTVYRDTGTGCIVWRMTCDPAVDVDDYYDIPSWNADGSVMSFLSWRSGEKTRWLMDANGANIRPMPTPGGKHIEKGYWSVIHRDRFYYAVVDEAGTHVVALNPFTGEEQEIVSVEQDLGEMMPPHPREEHFLFGKRQDQPGQTQVFNPEITDQPSWIYVLSVEGEIQEIELERRWHRLRFTKAPDLRIFFNYDNPRTQWTILPDGSERHEIPYSGGHPDWLADGSELTYYAEGSIWGVRYDGTERREIMRLGSGGHGGPCRDMVHFVSDTHGGGEDALYPDSVLYLRIDGSQVAHQLARPQSSFYAHTQLWHPDHHSTHPHPIASPDGTKTIFNSDALGEFSDIYVAVNRKPDPPRNLRARLDGRSVVLNWDEPEQCRELAGYNVYRFDESTGAWKQLTFRPQRGTGWRGPQRKENAYYVVTAVEHSGLESRPSNQVFQMGNELWEGYARLVYEAEAGEIELPMRPFVDMETASNLYYVGCAEGKAGGRLALRVDLPKSGPFKLWGRVRGSGALVVACDGDALGSLTCAGEDWSWMALDTEHTLMSGEHEVTLTPTTGGEAVDVLYITDDVEHVPEGKMALDTTPPATPEDVTVETAGVNAVKVSWQAVSVNDLDHYNVYVGESAEFPCEQATLVGSPSENELVDWGRRPGATYWYKVTAVDRWGNESEPSEAVEGALEEREPTHIELEARRAKRQNMEVRELPAVPGGRVVVPDGRGEAAAEWRFRLREDGEFALWGYSIHQRNEPTTFEVYIDDEKVGDWRVWGRWGEWIWSPMGRKWTGSPELFRIGAGRHTLRLVAQTPTAQVAQVVITDDPTWYPVTGFRGSNLPVT